jgi:hypothetical protein
MAVYYPAIARAVHNLEDNSAPAREELYERARAIIARELRGKDSGISIAQIMTQQAALEAAIRRVEVEFVPTQPQPDVRKANTDEGLVAMPEALGKMLIGITFNVAVVSLACLIYIKGLALVEAQVLGHSTLVISIVILLCVFAPFSWAMARKT